MEKADMRDAISNNAVQMSWTISLFFSSLSVMGARYKEDMEFALPARMMYENRERERMGLQRNPGRQMLPDIAR